jgi:DNA-nicking Smr family endonuclease
MRTRTLAPDEAALWARVMDTVRPLRAVARVMPPAVASAPPPVVGAPKRAAPPPIPARAVQPRPRPVPITGGTLDGGWDRRIGRGAVSPDDVIDLHGHTLASAHAMVDARLGEAVARGDRVLLLVTGRPPRPESERPHARGAIRAAVTDWLAASRHGSRIAAVRGAHPRHGGAGALYVVLRRDR